MLDLRLQQQHQRRKQQSVWTLADANSTLACRTGSVACLTVAGSAVLSCNCTRIAITKERKQAAMAVKGGTDWVNANIACSSTFENPSTFPLWSFFPVFFAGLWKNGWLASRVCLSQSCLVSVRLSVRTVRSRSQRASARTTVWNAGEIKICGAAQE